MKHILFGVFAHPDDEAFGPSGTLLRLARDGVDIYLVCATDGGNGTNPDNHSDLGLVRLKEWKASTAALQAKHTLHLGLQDGTLNNNIFHDIARKVRDFVETTCATYTEPLHIDFLTFDTNGVSGHIDHIVMSMVTSYVAHRLSVDPPEAIEVGHVMYFCSSIDLVPVPNSGYMFMPRGHALQNIGHIEDVSAHIDEKIAVMRLHHSQRGDANMLLSQPRPHLTREHFIIGF